MEGMVGVIQLGNRYAANEKKTYGVNGHFWKNTDSIVVQYCLTQETLIVMAIVAEDYNATGTTDAAVDLLSDACIVGPQGQRMVVEIY